MIFVNLCPVVDIALLFLYVDHVLTKKFCYFFVQEKAD